MRGLHFYYTAEILPEYWPTTGVQLYPSDTLPPEDVRTFISYAPPRGTYPGVFDYKFDRFDFPDGRKLHYWLLLLWDRIIVRVVFSRSDVHVRDVPAGGECSLIGRVDYFDRHVRKAERERRVEAMHAVAEEIGRIAGFPGNVNWFGERHVVTDVLQHGDHLDASESVGVDRDLAHKSFNLIERLVPHIGWPIALA